MSERSERIIGRSGLVPQRLISVVAAHRRGSAT
jgi:hypothetical protein